MPDETRLDETTVRALARAADLPLPAGREARVAERMSAWLTAANGQNRKMAAPEHLAVPCGFDDDGLPVGMQIIGQPFDEARLFRIVAAFQGATDFHTRAPAL